MMLTPTDKNPTGCMCSGGAQSFTTQSQWKPLSSIMPSGGMPEPGKKGNLGAERSKGHDIHQRTETAGVLSHSGGEKHPITT